MTERIDRAGITKTASPTAAVKAERILEISPGRIEPVVMVLAVHMNAGGKIAITPIDVEHERDDQRELSEMEMLERTDLRDMYNKNAGAMKEALTALYDLFNQRLYRTQFRTFENFCFALFGMHRIPKETERKARARVEKLKASLEEDLDL